MKYTELTHISPEEFRTMEPGTVIYDDKEGNTPYIFLRHIDGTNSIYAIEPYEDVAFSLLELQFVLLRFQL